MDEALAYKWAAQALKPLDDSGWEPHRHQQAADKVASAILEAYKMGSSQEQQPQSNMEWLVDKVDRKLRMFLKTKDTAYLKKAFSCLVDLLNEYDLYLSWKQLDERKKEEG